MSSLLIDLVGHLDAEDVVREACAGHRETSTRKLPDIVGWVDFAHHADETLGALVARAAGGYPVRSHQVRYPKDSEGERILTMLDSLDEIGFRAIGGRLLEHSDPRLGREVMASRMAVPPPGWLFGSFHYVLADRRTRAKQLAAQGDFRSMVPYDVKEYFLSLELDICRASLESLGVPPGCTEPVLAWLALLAEAHGVRGLPIGPETSAVLGTAVLHSVDSALRDANLTFIRYMDDIYVFHKKGQPESVSLQCVASALGDLGLELNTEKLDTLSSSEWDAHFAMRSEFLYGLPSTNLAEALEFQLATSVRDRSKVRQILRRAAGHPSKRLLTILMENPLLIDVAPLEAGLLLAAIFKRCRRDVDQDFVVECCTSRAMVQTEAGRLHALLAARRSRLSKDCGREIWRLVESDEGVPLRCFASDAWFHSEDMKPGRAVELAEAVGDPHLRRGLTLGLRRVSDGRSRRRCLQKVRTLGPECRPAARWIEEDTEAYQAA